MRGAKRLYVVFDAVAETVVGSVMIAPNDLAAKRAFTEAIQKGGFPVAEDYRLLGIGEVTDYGDVTPFDPATIVTGAEVVQTLKERG